MSYISLGVLVFSCLDTCDPCDILRYFVIFCKKWYRKIMHQKMRLRYFSVSWKNMRYLQLGIYRGFGIWWLLHICPCFSLEFYLASAKHQLWVHLWPFKKCCIVLVIINIRSGELSFPESSFQIWGEGRLEADIKLQFVWLKIRTFLLPCFSFLWSANCLLPISIAMLLFPLIWFKRGCSCLALPHLDFLTPPGHCWYPGNDWN